MKYILYICIYKNIHGHNYNLGSSSTLWVAYLEENSHINAVCLILFSFFFLPTLNSSLPLCTSSTNQVTSKVGPLLAHLAASLILLPSCMHYKDFLPSSHGDWVPYAQSTCWMAGHCLPLPKPAQPCFSNPLEFMAQSVGMLSGIIVLARGKTTWWWNCFSVC